MTGQRWRRQGRYASILFRRSPPAFCRAPTRHAPAAAGEYRQFLDLWAQAPADHPYVVEAKAEA